jgi:hypothetical protein
VATRWVLHTGEIDRVDLKPLLRDLADDVADDMRARAAALGGTGNLATGVDVTSVTNRRARISSKRPAGGGGSGPTQPQWAEEVPVFVERGTSDTPAQPYMRPALWRYRTP